MRRLPHSLPARAPLRQRRRLFPARTACSPAPRCTSAADGSLLAPSRALRLQPRRQPVATRAAHSPRYRRPRCSCSATRSRSQRRWSAARRDAHRHASHRPAPLTVSASRTIQITDVSANTRRLKDPRGVSLRSSRTCGCPNHGRHPHAKQRPVFDRHPEQTDLATAIAPLSPAPSLAAR